MGIYDREYYQEDEPRGFSFSSIARWPWSYRLIALYVVLFFVDHLLPAGQRIGEPGLLTQWGIFTTSTCFQELQLWRLFTHMFIEQAPLALLFAGLGLYFFGPMVESSLGRTKFLAYFIACGMGGAVISSLITPVVLRQEAFAYGAFGPIMGLLVAAGVFHPDRPVLFFFVLQTSMRVLVILSVILDGAFFVSGAIICGAYLGAALTGYLLLQSNALAFIDRFERRSRWSGPPSFKLPNMAAPFTPKPVSEEELDRLLTKVHEQGIGSLSSSEKALLKRASKQRRQR